MPIREVQFGSIYGSNTIKQQQLSGRELAVNFNSNNQAYSLNHPNNKTDVVAKILDYSC